MRTLYNTIQFTVQAPDPASTYDDPTHPDFVPMVSIFYLGLYASTDPFSVLEGKLALYIPEDDEYLTDPKAITEFMLRFPNLTACPDQETLALLEEFS